MLLYLAEYKRWIEDAYAALESHGPCAPELAEEIIRRLGHAEGLEEHLLDCERQARLWQIMPRDSVIGAVLELIDAYHNLVEHGEKLTGRRLNIPRKILERRTFWEEENDPLKLHVPGSGVSAG